MRYVILKAWQHNQLPRCYPFLFPEKIPHDEAAFHMKTLLLMLKHEDVSVFSAGTFTPETGAIRGARSLDILQGSADDEQSRYDDFLINTNDQTGGRI